MLMRRLALLIELTGKLIYINNNVNNMTAEENDFCLSLLWKELAPVRAVRDLGVMLDSNLTFNEHIVSTPCLHVCLYYIKRQIADKGALIIIINALVFSKRNYFIAPRLYHPFR